MAKTDSRKRLSKILMTVLLCLLSAAVLIFFPLFLTEKLDGVTDSTLTETSKKNAALMGYQLKNQCDTVEKLSEEIDTNIVKTDTKEAVERLSGIDITGALLRYGFASLDRHCYYISEDGTGTYSTIPESNHLEDAVNAGGITVYKLDKSQSIDNKSDVFIIQIPVIKDGTAIGIFYFTYDIDDIRQLLSSNSFGGQEHFAIIRSDGEIIASSVFDVFDKKNIKNIFDAMSEEGKSSQKVYSKITGDMQNMQSGIIRANNIYKGYDYYIYYSPLDFNDWYIVSYVPQNVVNSSRNTVLTYIFLMCFFLITVFVLFGIYITTEENQKQKEINQMLYTDSITGGASYAKFCLDAKKMLRKSKGNFAYIVMDIDSFKLVNDYYGYEYGNKTLRFIYSLWKELLGDDDAVCRIAADRFAVLMHCNSKTQAEKTVTEFSRRCHKYYKENSIDYILTPSIGIYFVKKGETNLQTLQTKAVMAKSLVKGQRENVFAFYSQSLNQTLNERKALEDELELAIENKTLNIFFQPQVNASTKKICGAEALVRWQRANGEFIPPDEFVSLAEEKDLINRLDRMIFEEVCKYQSVWQSLALPPIDFSVNLSQKSLMADRIAEKCTGTAKETGADINSIHIEITETTIFKNTKLFIKILRKLRKSGFKILLDDFGTGYSSLTLLKSMPVDILKLDKSFIDSYADSRGKAVIECVLDMAKRLNIEVIAEGVETEEQYQYLRNLNCNTIQGYLFGKPMTFEELQKTVITQNKNHDT